MAVHLLFGLLFLTMAGHSNAAFCVCKQGISQDILQKAIDYACGAGADCNPIRPNGQCYNPNSITAHCSYAVNSYYQKNAAKGATCSFNGAATLTNSDPSGGGCSYSATSGSTSTGTPTTTVPTTSPTTPTSTPVGVTPVSGTGVTPVSGTGTGTGLNPTTASPYTGSPNTGTGVLGGVNTGMAPTGSSFDDSDAGKKRQTMTLGSMFTTLASVTIMIMWN
ncbi:unnamed protein product [Amaranthus hypochondriacus]